MYKHNFLKIAVVTPICALGKPLENAQTIIDCASKSKASILLFPELCLTGYSIGDWVFNNELLYEHDQALKFLVDNSTSQVWIVGSIYNYNNSLFNVAYVIQNKKILGICPKTTLAKNHEFSDPRYFVTSSLEDEGVAVNIFGQDVYFGKMLFRSKDQNVIFGIEVCADLWAAAAPNGELYTNGADIVFNLSASTFCIGKNKVRVNLCKDASFKGQGAYVYASNGATETSSEVLFTGHQIVCELGNVLLDQENICFDNVINEVDIDIEKIRNSRLVNSRVFDVELGNLYMEEFNLEESEQYDLVTLPNPHPFMLSDEECEEVANVTTAALYKRLTHIGITNSVIGVSGGLDSSLAVMFAYDCYLKYHLDLHNLTGIMMKGLVDSYKSSNLAKKLLTKLGVNLVNLNISKEVKNQLGLLNHDLELKDTTYENAQSRYRTYCLMNYANMHQGIVLGTSDMSEIALGWSTFNGDQIAMYALNSGLPKTAVKCMVKYYADKYPLVKDILLEILAEPISPELTSTNQLTENIIGSYEINDFLLFTIFYNGYSKERIIYLLNILFKLSEDEATLYYERFMKRFKQNQFKRYAACEGVKIFDLGLSPRDLKFPGDMK